VIRVDQSRGQVPDFGETGWAARFFYPQLHFYSAISNNSWLFLDQENRARHFSDQFVIAAIADKVFQETFLMGKHHQQVNFFIPDRF
jgi:hypothetical protein